MICSRSFILSSWSIALASVGADAFTAPKHQSPTFGNQVKPIHPQNYFQPPRPNNGRQVIGHPRRERLQLASSKDSGESPSTSIDWATVAVLGVISSLYLYWMVVAAAAAANDWPGSSLIPAAIPLVPGCPPSDQDLQPVVEDSFHFFYLSELLQNPDAPVVNPLRLAAFNIDEAWIFAYLMALWKDPKRLPRPVLLGLWLILGINLTNAFLTPYLLVTEFNANNNNSDNKEGSIIPGKNPLVSAIFGVITTAVVTYATGQCLYVADAQAWKEFQTLVTTDRTYLAFCVDLPLFALLQPLILSRAKSGQELNAIDYVPILGLVKWMVFSNEEGDGNTMER